MGKSPSTTSHVHLFLLQRSVAVVLVLGHPQALLQLIYMETVPWNTQVRKRLFLLYINFYIQEHLQQHQKQLEWLH